jgi:hypothetical protein
MRSTLILSVIALAGCPSSPKGNPAILYLGPGDVSETMVQLVESVPPEY